MSHCGRNVIHHVHNVYFNKKLAHNSALNFNAQIYMLEQQYFVLLMPDNAYYFCIVYYMYREHE